LPACKWARSITSPNRFHLDEVRARVSQALDKRRLIIENRNYQQGLEERVEAQARRIEELFLEGVHALVFALEAKDAYTRGHSMRVANYSVEIARALDLDKDLIDTIALGAELHDVGKIGISEKCAAQSGQADGRRVSPHHGAYGDRGAHSGPADARRARRARDRALASRAARWHRLPRQLERRSNPVRGAARQRGGRLRCNDECPPLSPVPVGQACHAGARGGKGVQFDAEIVKAFLRAFAEGASLPIPTPQLQPLRLPTRAMEARRA